MQELSEMEINEVSGGGFFSDAFIGGLFFGAVTLLIGHPDLALLGIGTSTVALAGMIITSGLDSIISAIRNPMLPSA